MIQAGTILRELKHWSTTCMIFRDTMLYTFPSSDL